MLRGGWWLRQSLRPTRPAARFALDTFVTPTLYMLLDDLTRRTQGAGSMDPKERVAPLAAVVEQALHPTRGINSVELHKAEANIRFRTWVRQAYLDRMFGDSARLREAEALFLKDESAPPPTRASLDRVFGTGDWDHTPSGPENATQLRLVSEYERGDASRLQEWGLEELLESVGCCVAGMNEFNLFCERNFVYEFFTSEYIDALAQHLHASCREIQEKNPGLSHVTILEVGAGNGRLSQGLQMALARMQQRAKKDSVNIKMVATDTGVWKAKHRKLSGHKSARPSNFAVQQLDYRESLSTFKPQVVLCSWMPMNDDWSKAFRDTESVQEYLLVGEKDDGCCGHPWLTWGVRPDPRNVGFAFAKNKELFAHLATADRSLDLFHWLSRSGSSSSASFSRLDPVPDAPPPFTSDGFLRRDLAALGRLQLSRYDRKQFAANSHTVSFSRARS